MARISHQDTGSASSTISPVPGNEASTLEMLAYNNKRNQKGKERKNMNPSTTSSCATETSQSANLLSTHAMKMGFYTINLGTDAGQRLHTCHLVILYIQLTVHGDIGDVQRASRMAGQLDVNYAACVS